MMFWNSADNDVVAVPSTSESMTERERYRAPPQPEPPPHKVRAADLYPRLRTHYDEPGLDAGFTPICGEFVQWVGRTADGGTIAMSNYRLHAHPRRRTAPGASVPLRLIDALEVSELLHLIVLCKNGRQLKLSFTTSEQCAEWFRRLNTALAPMGSVQETFAAAYAAWAKELPLTSVHRQLLAESQGQQKPWFGRELERLEFTVKGAWRVTAVNADYKLCASYPPLLVVPASIGDEDLDSVARFRALRRIPTAVWRHRGNGAVIARSSQPEVGWFGWRSSEDEKLLAAFATACQEDRGNSGSSKTPVKLLIVDARSYASAVTNRARGGGCECQQYYPAADIQFMALPNIHHVRRSFQQLRALCAEPPDQPNWHSSVERSLWLQYVSGVCRAAVAVGRAVCAGRPVLVHCSDGWDRTPQIVAAAQLLLDPYYRTIEGFRVLIEREWLDFGHKFADRCGHQFGPEEPNERSPIFLQWLDVVYQVMRQFPCTFEFNEAYLIKLATHVHSCMFGTFLCNNGRERAEARLQEHTAQLWRLLADSPAYRNHVYSPQSSDQVIYPECGSRYMRVWWGLFSPAAAPQPDGPPPHIGPTSNYTPAPANGVMTKTRSCDNLAVEGERRTAQRRCSDPSIAPDLMKLSSVVGECRSALTDSCVDQLPALPALPVNNHYDQVDGPSNQLECSTSGRSSSSVERELERAAAADNSTDTLTTDGVVPVSIDVVDLASQPSVVIPAPPAVQRVCGAGGRGASAHSAAGSPDDALFLADTYNVIGIADAAREASRARNVSITWRSLSESSNQSSNGFDIETPHQRPEQPLGLESLPLPHESSPIELESSIIRDSSPIGLDTSPLESSPIRLETLKMAHENSPLEMESSIALESLPMRLESSLERDSSPEDLDNHNATNGDVINHNILALTNGKTVNVNGVNGLDEIDTNGCGTSVGTSSSLSSESEAECGPRGGRRPSGSQLTLCPAPAPALASPRHHHDGHTKCPDTATSNRRTSATSGIETSGESVSSTCGARCGCGASGDACVSSGGGTQPHRAASTAHGGGSWPTLPTIDPIDGLPPHIDPLQARLHQIIVAQKMVVEELSRQLREARCALSRASGSPHGAPARPPRTSPSAPEPSQLISSSRSGSSGGSVSSGSGSGSEVEVGEEARGVVWLPDRAAPRCQHCHHHFWLARRRHHCRRCGGIFCGSCSEVSAWGSCAVRMCRRCRAQR